MCSTTDKPVGSVEWAASDQIVCDTDKNTNAHDTKYPQSMSSFIDFVRYSVPTVSSRCKEHTRSDQKRNKSLQEHRARNKADIKENTSLSLSSSLTASLSFNKDAEMRQTDNNMQSM
uniref:Cytochrome P450 71D10 n=1 Tax=Lygus hesperus TaxID=30085 RepID=A0A0A9XQS5_LYGHE